MLQEHALVDDDADPEAAALLGLLTPIVKTWPSEYGLAANDIAIQIHGGYGYTRDFDVEQLWRDNRLNPIHEGTTGIQAMDLLGRKILRDGTALPVLGRAMERTMEAARAREELSDHAAALSVVWSLIGTAIDRLRSADGAEAFDNATPFLWAFGHVVVAWLWLDQADAALRLDVVSTEGAGFVAGKVRTCRFFFEAELPKVEPLLRLVAPCTDVTAGTPSEIF